VAHGHRQMPAASSDRSFAGKLGWFHAQCPGTRLKQPEPFSLVQKKTIVKLNRVSSSCLNCGLGGRSVDEGLYRHPFLRGLAHFEHRQT